VSEITTATLLADFQKEITPPGQWIIQRWYHRQTIMEAWTYWWNGPKTTVDEQLAEFRRQWWLVEDIKYRTDTIPATVAFTSVSLRKDRSPEKRRWKLEIAPP